ncbi:Mbeg1-like protein [Streptococcus ferus]|uniref:Lipase n=1 Tax=Streptococcus ferus TaxID=1345 RepID=A0A2X3W5J1_9STRE|nr:Mbeg1-like protein [Streptococcus ferus]SQF40817.1 lipase [Streptococcus ferus]
MPNSNIATLDASNLSYEFEKARIDGATDSNIVQKARKNNKSIPSNLVYLEDTYDKATGTSATAFQDKQTGEIIIAYTGTNVESDGLNDVVESDFFGIVTASGDHYQPAFDFYEKIEKKYGSRITLTGHSLGGNLAQRVALKYNVQNTVVYNAAPLYLEGLISSRDKILDYLLPDESVREKILKEQKRFTGQVTRIRTEKDPLNKWANRFGGVYLGKEYTLDASGGHGLDPAITGDKAQLAQLDTILSTKRPEKMTAFEQKQLAILQSAQTSLLSVAALKESFMADGSLNSHERFYLDSLQASTIASAMTSAVSAGNDEITANSEKAVDEAEALYQKTKTIPWFVTELSAEEVQAAYEEAGVTYDSIVTKTQKHFDKTVTKMSAIETAFSNLESRIQTGIEEAVAADESLAGDINQWTSSM